MQHLRRIFLKIIKNEIVLAIIIALLIKAFILDSRYVPSESMYPTLQVNDRLLVNKLAYVFSEPQRGDIVIFSPPPSVADGHDYVKRIIGLPGEEVKVKNNHVYIDSERLEEHYINEPPEYKYGPKEVPEEHILVLGDNRNESYDGHVWEEWLPIDYLKGKAFVRYWPLDRVGWIE